jgi:hypothetical protein
MLAQVVYQTNADYFDSCDVIAKNPLVVSEKTGKGIMTFRFAESRTVFLLSPEGKLQVKWNDVSEKRALYKLVKKLLVPKNSETLVIKPLKQQTWIDYPVPDSFKLYWCDQYDELLKNTSSNECDIPRKAVPKVKYEVGTVRQALEDLRREFAFLREPTFNEVALKSGCMDSSTVRIGLTLGSWKCKSAEEAEWTAEKAIDLAGWLKVKEKGDLDPRLIKSANKAIEAASIDVVKKAQDILRNYPELVADVTVKGVSWPDEMKTKWVKVFGCAPPIPRYLREMAENSRRLLLANEETLSALSKKRFPFNKISEKTQVKK